MNPALLAIVWVALGAGVTLVTGKGISRGQVRRAPQAARQAAPAPREFVTPDLHDIAGAAHSVALEALLSTRPGAIRRVPAR